LAPKSFAKEEQIYDYYHQRLKNEVDKTKKKQKKKKGQEKVTQPREMKWRLSRKADGVKGKGLVKETLD